jgi:hypothetical protein
MDYKTEILRQVLSALEIWGSALSRLDTGDWKEGWARNRKNPFAVAFKTIGITYIPAQWAEWGNYSIDAAGRQQFSRAARRLEAAGLLVRVCSNGRLTHVRPTAAGLSAAIQQAVARGDAPDLPAIHKALAEATWATDEHRRVVDGKLASTVC